MSIAKVVTDSSFDSEVLRNPRPVIVEYWAEWCGPCRRLAPVLDSIAADHADRLDLVKINVDENPGTVGKYGILHVPTVAVFFGGEVVRQVVGAKSRAAMLRDLAGIIEPSAV